MQFFKNNEILYINSQYLLETIQTESTKQKYIARRTESNITKGNSSKSLGIELSPTTIADKQIYTSIN